MFTIQDIVEKAQTEVGLNELMTESTLMGEKVTDTVAYIESNFGDDADTILENMLNSNEDPLMVLSMMALHENIPLNEFIVKRVDSKGNITKIKDRATRKRLATQTTGLSKSKRMLIARKAAKTKRADPAGKRKAQRKRKRAMTRRRVMGL